MKTFDKNVANEFEEILKCVDNVYTHLFHYKSLKFVNQNLCGADGGEYGLYIKDSNKKVKNELFVGLWLDYWKDSGFPVVITIQSCVVDKEIIKKEMTKMQTQYPKYFDKFHVYENFPVLALTDYAVFNDNCHFELCEITYRLCRLIGL